jgi:flagellar biosynthetic protein FliR
LAAPMLVTMLLTDVVLGFLGKTMPQINVMTAGLPLRSLVGMVVLIFGLMICSRVIEESILNAVKEVAQAFAGAMA